MQNNEKGICPHCNGVLFYLPRCCEVAYNAYVASLAEVRRWEEEDDEEYYK